LKILPDDIEGDLLMGATTRLFGLDKPQANQLTVVTGTKGKNEHTSG